MTGLVLFFLFFLGHTQDVYFNALVQKSHSSLGFHKKWFYVTFTISCVYLIIFLNALLLCLDRLSWRGRSRRRQSSQYLAMQLCNKQRLSHYYRNLLHTSQLQYMLRPYVILIVAIIIITCRDPLSGPILNFPENVRKTTNPSQIYQSQLQCD